MAVKSMDLTSVKDYLDRQMLQLAWSLITHDLKDEYRTVLSETIIDNNRISSEYLVSLTLCQVHGSYLLLRIIKLLFFSVAWLSEFRGLFRVRSLASTGTNGGPPSSKRSPLRWSPHCKKHTHVCYVFGGGKSCKNCAVSPENHSKFSKRWYQQIF